jgi:hypothetical protein
MERIYKISRGASKLTKDIKQEAPQNRGIYKISK